MSKIITSIFSKSLSVGFFLLPYNDIIGNPVLLSIEFIIFSPASELPLNPCSGAKTFKIFTSLLISESTKCVLFFVL